MIKRSITGMISGLSSWYHTESENFAHYNTLLNAENLNLICQTLNKQYFLNTLCCK